MVYRAAVLSLLGVLVLLHVTSELRELGRDIHVYEQLHALRHAAADAAPAPAPAIELPEGVVVVDAARAALDRMMADDHALGPARVIPSLRDGQMIGFKLYGIRAESLLGTLGLRSGDTLIAINDVPVTDTAETLRVFEDDQLPAYLDLTVRRQGRALRIVVLIHG
jgi:type II secretory pathway component PulC